MAWTVEQVMALAPDAASAKSGKDLSAPRKWKTLGTTEVCAWGTIQGSGAKPYQACIDLHGPAFKCTCPSRKFPCKHGLGLFLILAQQPESCSQKAPPDWATEWLGKRAEKEEKKTSKASEPATPPDPEAEKKAAAAAEKRAATREARVDAGLGELETWLQDLARAGFANLRGKPSSFWETPAARLVDAQAPGLARRVRSLAGISSAGENWPALLLREVALLHLAREGWTRIGELPPPLQADLRGVIGFNLSQEEVLEREAVRDRWWVVAQKIEEDERLRTQRTWLLGQQSKQFALCLSFSAGPNQPLDVTLIPGTSFEGEVVFFPGAWPMRGLVKSRASAADAGIPELPHRSIAEANTFYAQGLSANPWLERVPIGLKAVIPAPSGETWIAREPGGNFIPLRLPELKGWTLMALSGGQPIGIMGEWNGEELTPLTILAEGRFVRL